MDQSFIQIKNECFLLNRTIYWRKNNRFIPNCSSIIVISCLKVLKSFKRLLDVLLHFNLVSTISLVLFNTVIEQFLYIIITWKFLRSINNFSSFPLHFHRINLFRNIFMCSRTIFINITNSFYLFLNLLHLLLIAGFSFLALYPLLRLILRCIFLLDFPRLKVTVSLCKIFQNRTPVKIAANLVIYIVSGNWGKASSVVEMPTCCEYLRLEHVSLMISSDLEVWF